MTLEHNANIESSAIRAALNLQLADWDAILRDMEARGNFDEEAYDAIEDEFISTCVELHKLDPKPFKIW
jgi:hypothetical protein